MFTLDEYYDINFYIQGIQALRNNGVEYKEYIMTKAPYNWYIDSDDLPIMVNYDKLPNNMQKYIINKVEPATPSDEYILARKDAFEGIKGLRECGLNKPLIQANKSDYACFFKVKNRDQLLKLSDTLGTIYYFGKYYNNTRVGLCFNKMIKNYVTVDDIMIEKEKNATQMELDLNFKIFRLNDRLRKFTETPSFKNGKYYPVKVKQFNLTI